MQKSVTLLVVFVVVVVVCLWSGPVSTARPPASSPCIYIKCKECVDLDNIPYCRINGKKTCKMRPQKREIKPVCGSNNRTYNNPFELAKDSCRTKKVIRIERYGNCSATVPETGRGLCRHTDCNCRLQNGIPKCITADGKEICPEPFQGKMLLEVCASDGNTYMHPSRVAAKSCKTNTPISISHFGRCKTTKKPNPEDGGESKDICRYTHSCNCRLQNGIPKCITGDGKENCPEPSPLKILVQVCASDGNTYMHPSEVAAKSCKTNTPISISHFGRCKTTKKPNPEPDRDTDLCLHVHCNCTLRNKIPKCIAKDGKESCPEATRFKIRIEVCASDGNTYQHPSAVGERSCKTNTPLEILHRGPCKTSENPKPQLIGGPLGQDESKDLCKYTDCTCNLKNGIPKCIDNEGQESCPRTATKSLMHVCGGDGKSYGHPNSLARKSCETNTPLKIAYFGKCETPTA